MQTFDNRIGRGALGVLLTCVLAACSSKSSGSSASASASAASGPSAEECKAFDGAMDKADDKAVQLIVPGVTTFDDLKKAADEVQEGVKLLTAPTLTDAKLIALRDTRKKQYEAFITAARGATGSADAAVPKEEAEKIGKLANAITSGGIEAVGEFLKACPP